MVSLISMAIQLKIPEARKLTKLCPNLNQFFLVTFLVFLKNFLTIRAVVLKLCCKQMAAREEVQME